MDHVPDQDLVERSRNGDMASFKEFVNRHQGKVAGVICSILGQGAEAEDVGQEVFVKFYESLNKFKGESAPATYLIRIAINRALNEAKKRKRKNTLFTSIEHGKHVKITDEEDMDKVIQVELNKLDPDFQSVVTLRLMEGYSTQETADILNIPLGTVLSRLSRAQKRLREVLIRYV
jgi:RNA polymerase sigma-70 factor, ECF subfamily